MTTLLYLHGVGDDGTRRDWWERLTLSAGAPLNGVSVVAPDYGDLLTSTGPIAWTPEPPTTRLAVTPLDRRRYRAEQADLHQVLVSRGSNSMWPHRRRGFARVPGMIDAIGERVVIGMLYGEVGRYVDDELRRRAILNRVLRLVPAGPVVIIGHSLGALVALELIRHLPPDTDVPLLVTAASALARRKLPANLNDLNSQFPYDRVDGWVNVFNPADPVTRGLPIGLRFPQAIDVSVGGGFANHDLATCLADEGVARVIAQALYPRPTPAHEPTGDLELASALNLATLQFTWHMEQILATDPATTAPELTRFAMARRVIGERSALVGDPEHHDWDRDHAHQLRHAIGEVDLPAVLVHLVGVDPLDRVSVTVRPEVGDEARRRVLADLGVPPSWMEVARRSRLEAATAFRPLRRRGKAPDPESAPDDEDIAATITLALHQSLLPLAVSEVPPSARFPGGVGDIRPACVELLARALTAHRLGTPAAGTRERTVLSRLMVVLGEHRVRIAASVGGHDRLRAELGRRAAVVAESLSWLARQGVGLEPTR
ncbi:MAG: hypothetical protein V9E98_03890 [Candidatus Nanopelagicales bacterium]